jgi:hypothetical protein
LLTELIVAYLCKTKINNVMAKATSKPATKVETKPAAKAPAKKAIAKDKASPSIESISKAALEKLIALKLDHQLQSDIQWCLGSYSHDKNPVGLIDGLHRAAHLFKAELAKKTKGVTAKLIADIEEAVKG